MQLGPMFFGVLDAKTSGYDNTIVQQVIITYSFMMWVFPIILEQEHNEYDSAQQAIL